uniref:GON domain-containing protein n=1 Tax=Knipowitschia caucasica TaxID=637954 RepID=A0AAV2M8W4_KNICA
MDASECDLEDRPHPQQDCAMSQCPSPRPDPRLPPSSPNSNTRNSLPHNQAHQWRTGPWGACSSTCAGGFQRRVVVCQDENGYPANSCEEHSRPGEQRSCEAGPCPQWIYGDWGECTKTCGGGVKTRLVVCQRPNGERFNDLSCEIHDKPPDREQCSTQPCPSGPHWSTGPWSSCGNDRSCTSCSCTSCSCTSCSCTSCSCTSCSCTSSGSSCTCTSCSSCTCTSCSCTSCSCSLHLLLLHLCSCTSCSCTSCSCTSCSLHLLIHAPPCTSHSQHLPLLSAPPAPPCSSCSLHLPLLPTPPAPPYTSPSSLHLPLLPTPPPPPCTSPSSLHLPLLPTPPAPPYSSCSSLHLPLLPAPPPPPCTSPSSPTPPPPPCTSRSSLHLPLLPAPPAPPCSSCSCSGEMCSASCGRGSKFRKVNCVTGSGRSVADQNCLHLSAKPGRERRCRGAQCPRWSAGDWEECSVKCGDGIQRREVFCQTGDLRSPVETDCSPHTRPASSQSCRGEDCPSVYRWREGQWQACSQSCGSGLRQRALQCVDDQGKEVHEVYCVNQIKPPHVESCNPHACEYMWVTGDWSQCSVSCGRGYRHRLVSCSEAHTEKGNYEYSPQSLSSCPDTPPESYTPCDTAPCGHMQEWRVGSWGQCSVSCGVGVMRRTVKCVEADGKQSHRCSADVMPDSKKSCTNHQTCIWPQRCLDVRRRSGPLPDSEHVLHIQGKALKVYCAGMQTEMPQEYISLTTGERENFSEIFGFRLKDPTLCPANSSNREDCDCRKDYTAAGLTTFSKVRLDISTMTIITTDWLFAFTRGGQKIPFATAGDCFSSSRCPQGQFRLNLSGTGFKVADNNSWISHGNYAVADIQKSPDGSRVSGVCGGYCGKCTPSAVSRLPVAVQ